MGLYDEILCEYPLPDGWTQPPGTVFQTKDTDDLYFVRFTLDVDGVLRRPTGEPVAHHGSLEFYTSNLSACAPWGCMTSDDAPPWSARYVALFDHGRILKIEGQWTRNDEPGWMKRDEWHRKSRGNMRQHARGSSDEA